MLLFPNVEKTVSTKLLELGLIDLKRTKYTSRLHRDGIARIKVKLSSAKNREKSCSTTSKD